MYTQNHFPPGVTATLKAYAYDHRITHSAPYLINGEYFRINFRDGAKEPFYRPAE
jgi:hypothetical protein